MTKKKSNEKNKNIPRPAATPFKGGICSRKMYVFLFRIDVKTFPQIKTLFETEREHAKNASRHSGELRIQGFSEAKRERKIRRIPRGGLSIFLACFFGYFFN